MPSVSDEALNRNSPSKEQIADYFTEMEAEYTKEVGDGVPDEAMHFGYFDEEHTEFPSAIINMKRTLTDAVDIGPDDRVLEAGCGMGETSTWIAREIGAEMVGINICERQLEIAREMADRRGVTDSVDFRYDDYTEMETIEDESVDVVWGLESICYAKDKREVLEQAERVLRPGGRIMVADWFMNQRTLTEDEREMVELWLQGWKIPDLAYFEDFQGYLRDLGFDVTAARDITENIRPSVAGFECRQRRKITYPVSKVLNAVGLVSDYRYEQERGCFYQHKVYDEELAIYGLVTAEK